MAIATESGYGAFLPKGRNEFVDREMLRGQMVKQASYLTGMDTTYAQLEEQARQFDESMELKESQFGRKLDFEYKTLEEQADYWDQQISLGWGQQATSERIAGIQAETSRYGIDASARAQSEQMAFQRETQEKEFEFKQQEFATKAAFTASLMADYTRPDETTDKDLTLDTYGGELRPEQETIKSGEVSTGYNPPTYKQYDYSGSKPLVTGGYF